MAFSFTKTGFGGFSDPKTTEDKLVNVSSSSTVEKLKPKPGYLTGGRKITYTINKTFSNSANNNYSGSDSFKTAFRKARSSGLSTFNFGGKSYTTELKVPKTRTETSSITSVMEGIKANPINITAPTLLTNPSTSTTKKIIPPPPPSTYRRKRKRNGFFKKVGKFFNSRDWFPFDNLRDYGINLGGSGKRQGRCSCK